MCRALFALVRTCNNAHSGAFMLDDRGDRMMRGALLWRLSARFGAHSASQFGKRNDETSFMARAMATWTAKKGDASGFVQPCEPAQSMDAPTTVGRRGHRL